MAVLCAAFPCLFSFFLDCTTVLTMAASAPKHRLVLGPAWQGGLRAVQHFAECLNLTARGLDVR
jgi:hypothetical protein